MCFGSALGNIAPGLSTYQACEVGAMTQGNIASTIIVFNAKELKISKSDVTLQWLHFVMVLLCQDTESHCNGCVAFKKAVGKYFIKKDVCFRFCLFCSSMFINKTPSFLTTDYSGKYQTFGKDF